LIVLDAPGLGFRVVMVGPGDYRVCPRGGVVGARSFASATEAALSGLEEEKTSSGGGLEVGGAGIRARRPGQRSDFPRIVGGDGFSRGRRVGA